MVDQEALKKVENYSKGFVFTIVWPNIPKEKHQAMRNFLHYCWQEKHLIEPISSGLGWDVDGEFKELEEKWRRI